MFRGDLARKVARQDLAHWSCRPARQARYALCRRTVAIPRPWVPHRVRYALLLAQAVMWNQPVVALVVLAEEVPWATPRFP